MDDTPLFVVVGAGQAGGWAAKTLRDEGFDGRVIIVGEEPYLPHERPPLSKEVLLGSAEKGVCQLWPEQVLTDAGIEMRLGQRVTAIDPSSHSLTLDDGEVLRWTKLMLATGGRARNLDVSGIDLDGVFTLRTIPDSEAIGARLSENRHVVIVGAGWIGLEVAAAARQRGARVTVLEVADRACARALTQDMSDWVLDLHQRHGVSFRLNTELSHFEGNGAVERVVLADGEELPCELAVIGIGIVPNVELAEAAGLPVENGIVVDSLGCTAHPDIFAAGDVTRHPNPLLEKELRLESWENAQNQAINTAKAMLGTAEPYAEIPWFWSDQYDANIQLMGLPEEWDQTVIRGDREGGQFIEFYLGDGRLKGAAAVNNARDLRFTRRMMMADRTYDPVALADPAVKLQKLLRG